jgi:hypothetical protein
MQNSPPLDRERARAILKGKIEAEKRILADPYAFTTISPQYIIDDAEWRLRWIDCAPAGARYLLAPMQDKTGTPMGSVWDENLGPCLALREAYVARGRNPFSGLPNEPSHSYLVRQVMVHRDRLVRESRDRLVRENCRSGSVEQRDDLSDDCTEQ